MAYKEALEHLGNRVDKTVSSLGRDTTADYKFRAIRLLENDLSTAISDVAEQIKNLRTLGKQFQEGNGQTW